MRAMPANAGFGLTRLAGWAERFIAAGASVFVGSLWEVNDTLAGRFVIEFYNRLFGLVGLTPQPLGQAFREARLVIKDLDPANPAWLAYVLYGNPNTQVMLIGTEIESTPQDAGRPAEPAITDITTQLPRDPAGFVKRPETDIKAIVINHTGVGPEVNAERVAQAQRARWPGIVGQYFITVDGEIQQTNPIDEVVTRDQSWIYDGINIYVAGNFDEAIPSEVQMDALARLVAWLQWKYRLPESAIRGVGEYIETRSPAFNGSRASSGRSSYWFVCERYSPSRKSYRSRGSLRSSGPLPAADQCTIPGNSLAEPRS